jgi:RNA polymerase sigma factor (sigma-70 family)
VIKEGFLEVPISQPSRIKSARVICIMKSFPFFNGCKEGNPQAQRLMYDHFKGILMGICRRYAKRKEEAQDILQDAFIKIFRNIHRLESDEKLEGWVKSITVRTAIDHYHKAKAHQSMFTTITEGSSSSAGVQLLSEATDEFLLRCIGELPDGCRMTFNLFVVEGYDHAEIAKMLEVSESTSRSQLHRAKQLLQEKLKSQSLADYYEKLA